MSQDNKIVLGDWKEFYLTQGPGTAKLSSNPMRKGCTVRYPSSVEVREIFSLAFETVTIMQVLF